MPELKRVQFAPPKPRRGARVGDSVRPQVSGFTKPSKANEPAFNEDGEEGTRSVTDHPVA